MTYRIAGLLPALALATACGNEPAASTAVTLRPCAVALATSLTLVVAGDTTIDPASDSGCVTFPKNVSASDSAEYLVIAQAAGGPPGDSTAFQLRSAALASGSAPARLPAAAALRRHAPIPVAFDHFLRELARTHGASLRAPPGPPRPATSGRPAGTITPPGLGTLHTFTVCANQDCSVFKPVTARVRALGAHVALYVDTLAPANGLDSAALVTLTRTFDIHGYVVDTVAFGGVSDIDSNGVVIALMTPVVNSLVTAAACKAGGYVAGFFFPLDLDPQTASQYNHGEIFYTIVADPSGTLSCAHTVADVEFTLPATFVHELQHIISFNQHVLIRGSAVEDIWLDEALSSFAEELAGRSYFPDTATFSQYAVPLLYNASLYLAAPDDYFLLQTGDTVLAEFGAGWLYMRYLVDQFGSGLSNKLEQTVLTGTDNVAAQTGLPFATTVTRWALALWVSDLPGFTPPPALTYTSWSFRRTFASLHAQDPTDFPSAFPLAPVADSGTGINVAGFLRGGSGSYVQALQGPGAASFTLLFSGNGGLPASTAVPRLSVIRIH
ncbi:MAG: hypothetical protein ABR998_14320 [Gemmatimonadales bacterium]|jgi:hypothetical protein